MKLNKFTLDNACIAHNNQKYDLSSGYAFVGLEYDVINQELNLKWIKGVGNDKAGQPDELLMEFSEVDFFKARGRDIAKPYPMDEPVTSMGFAANNQIDEFGGSYQSAADSDHQHLSFEFASGLAIKFSAAAAILKTKTRF